MAAVMVMMKKKEHDKEDTILIAFDITYRLIMAAASHPVVPQQIIHQSEKILCNRSLALKLEQNIVIDIY